MLEAMMMWQDDETQFNNFITPLSPAGWYPDLAASQTDSYSWVFCILWARNVSLRIVLSSDPTAHSLPGIINDFKKPKYPSVKISTIPFILLHSILVWNIWLLRGVRCTTVLDLMVEIISPLIHTGLHCLSNVRLHASSLSYHLSDSYNID